MLGLQIMTPASQLTPVVTDIAVATVFSFVLSMALTPIYTNLAFRFKAWKVAKTINVMGERAVIYSRLHAAKHKRHIPTMAGIIMLVAISVVTLTTNLSRPQTYLLLFGTIAAGLVGLLDDFINIRGSGGIAGLRSKIKFLLVLGIALAAGLYSYYKLGYTAINLPFIDSLSLGWLIVPLFAFVILATANAVNITDGLDGLSGGLLSMAFAVYAIIALFQGNTGIAIFCGTVVGTLLSYTWFNIHPARFFMGDTGSFALGTALALVALQTDTIFLLPIIGGMFVLEAGSSLLQMFSKKVFKRKIFQVAPVHHHFEAIGWPETKVTMRFWVLGAIFGAMGLALAIWGGQL